MPKTCELTQPVTTATAGDQISRSEKARQLRKLQAEYRYLKAELETRSSYSRWVKRLDILAIRAAWTAAKPWQRRFLACRLLDIDQTLIDERAEQMKSHYPDNPPAPSPELRAVLQAMQYRDMSFKDQSDAWGRLADMKGQEVPTQPGRIPSHKLHSIRTARAVDKWMGRPYDAGRWEQFGTAAGA